MILISDRESKEVAVDSIGVICGCRLNDDNKIEFHVKINGQKIWVLSSSVFCIPTEKDFNGPS